MSARSAQRTRWRRWRVGRDIAGRKDRDGRMSGCQAQIFGGVTTLCIGSASSSSFGLLMKQISLFEQMLSADRCVYLEQKEHLGEIMPNSPKGWTRKRDFAHQIGLFEKPNGHVTRWELMIKYHTSQTI